MLKFSLFASVLKFCGRKQLGGKLGSSLESDLGLKTVGDLLKFPEHKLQERYGINTGYLINEFNVGSFLNNNNEIRTRKI